MLRIDLVCGVLSAATLARPAWAQQPSTEEMMRQIEALKRRVEELESRERDREGKRPAAAACRPATVRVATPPATPLAPAPEVAASAPGPQSVAATVPGLLPPERMGHQWMDEDALRSDLPGLSIRIPGTQSEVRWYGFAKLSTYSDFDGRNQTDTPPPHLIPLVNSAADMQGGDTGMTARFSRFGMDTRTLTSWGTVETRLEGDFGGGAPASPTALFRLRQGWAEVGTEAFRVLIGQANSLWNEGVFETVNDATNLNQSFVRQPQIRATAALTPGLTGQVSLEAPDTQYTSAAGVSTPTINPIGGLSPAFNSVPDSLGRLGYLDNGMDLNLRGLLRELTVRTAGTAAAPPALAQNALGWGLASYADVPMRLLSEAFGPDELIGMAY
jgi:hypothetical protein